MKAIKNIRVQRPENTITFMPAWMCGMLQDNSCVISIIYEGEHRPTFGPHMTVLELTDEGCGLTPEMFHRALRFTKENIGRNINIHCHQGRIRSKTLAHQLATVLPQYKVLEWKPDGVLFESNPEPKRCFRFPKGFIRKHLFGDKQPYIVRSPIITDKVMRPDCGDATVIFEDSDKI